MAVQLASQVSSVTLDAKSLYAALSNACRTCKPAKGNFSPLANKVFLECTAGPLLIHASDGFRLIRAEVGADYADVAPLRFTMTADAAKALLKKLPKRGEVLASWADDRSELYIAGHAVTPDPCTPPNWNHIIEDGRTRETIVGLDAEALPVLTRWVKSAARDKDISTVWVETRAGRLYLTASDEAQYSLQLTVIGPDVAIALDPRYLVDMLLCADKRGDTMLLGATPLVPVHMGSQAVETLVVLMPVNIGTQAKPPAIIGVDDDELPVAAPEPEAAVTYMHGQRPTPTPTPEPVINADPLDAWERVSVDPADLLTALSRAWQMSPIIAARIELSQHTLRLAVTDGRDTYQGEMQRCATEAGHTSVSFDPAVIEDISHREHPILHVSLHVAPDGSGLAFRVDGQTFASPAVPVPAACHMAREHHATDGRIVHYTELSAASNEVGSMKARIDLEPDMILISGADCGDSGIAPCIGTNSQTSSSLETSTGRLRRALRCTHTAGTVYVGAMTNALTLESGSFSRLQHRYRLTGRSL